MPNSRYTFGNAQQQRRLTRLRKLRHVTDDQIGLTSNHIIDRSFSLPGSPETTLARNDCKPRSLDGLQHWSSSAVPKPLPLPEVFMNQKSNVSGTSQLASPDERLAFSGRRKNADSAAKTTAKSLSNVRKGFYHDEPIEIFKNSPKPSVATTSRGVKSFFSTPASRQRSNNQDHFYSYDDADSAKSSLSRHRGFSPKNYGSVDHNLRLNVHPRSAPTTALSSPSISPQRSRTVGPFHSDHLVLLQNNLQENAYPLPLPPGALQPSQSPLPRPSPVSNHLIEKPITKPIVATTSRGVTSFFSTPASPQRSNNQDHFYSYDVADSAKSLLSHRRGFSLENYGSVYHNLRLNVHPRSAPTTAFSSPVSPKRSRTVGPFHSDHSEWLQNNRQVNVYPLPLPPGALPPSQSRFPQLSPVSNHLIEKPITNSMISQWKKGRLLGRGTYGSVYEATNRETGALCAMKEVDIIPDDPKSLECIKQLEQEISVLRHLNHQNIVRYYGSEIVDDHFYIYLEYIHPGSINKHVREHCGAITESVVRNFTRHIISGLAYLHSLNIIHRDIKGANLLVDANGVVKLADFGVAKHLTGLSYELSLKGSPHWMAPEVIKAAMQKDSSSNLALAVDIWSLGCTVIEMVNGRPPWSELEGPQAMFKVLNKTPPIPEALSPEGKDFLRCCFRRNPAERPPAAMLLEHPFLRNSADQNGSILMQAFSRLNLTDNLNSAINFPTHKTEVKSTSSGRSITKGKSAYNSETVQLGYAQTMNCAVASHHPLFSTPEVSTHTSATGLNHGSHSFSPSSHVSSNMSHAAVNNHPCAVGRTQGTKIRHI